MNSQSNSFSPGDTVIGTVCKVEPQGALINLGAEIFAYIPLHQMSIAVEKGRISISTKQLEPEPGALLKNPQLVYEKAEEMAAQYRQKMQEQQEISV